MIDRAPSQGEPPKKGPKVTKTAEEGVKVDGSFLWAIQSFSKMFVYLLPQGCFIASRYCEIASCGERARYPLPFLRGPLPGCIRLVFRMHHVRVPRFASPDAHQLARRLRPRCIVCFRSRVSGLLGVHIDSGVIDPQTTLADLGIEEALTYYADRPGSHRSRLVRPVHDTLPCGLPRSRANAGAASSCGGYMMLRVA